MNAIMFRRVLGIIVPVALAAAAWSARGAAQQPRATYTAAEAAAGKTAYDQRCAACHGDDLKGGGAPALTGSSFVAAWGARSAADLFQFITAQMPPGGPSLSDDACLAVVAYILNVNGQA